MRDFIVAIVLVLWCVALVVAPAHAQVQHSNAPYPGTAIAETASGTGVAAATAVATLAASVGRTTYLSGFCVTTGNLAVVENGLVAVTGTVTGTLDYEFVETVAGGQLCEQFNPPVPASGTDVPIVVTLPAITSGAAGAVTAYGFQL